MNICNVMLIYFVEIFIHMYITKTHTYQNAKFTCYIVLFSHLKIFIHMVKYQMACENVQLHLKQTSVDVMGPFLFTHVKILIPMRKMSCMNVYNSHVKI